MTIAATIKVFLNAKDLDEANGQASVFVEALNDHRSVGLADNEYASLAGVEEVEQEPEEQSVCEWCGEPANDEQGPLEQVVVSPPTDGYPFEQGMFHKDCGSAYARSLVR